MMKRLIFLFVGIFISMNAFSEERLSKGKENGTPDKEQAAFQLSDIIELSIKATVLGTGYNFSEGPAVDAVGNVYFSARLDKIQFYAYGRPVELFTDDTFDPVAMMFNRDGKLIVTEGAASRIVEFDVRTKEKRTIVSEFEGLRFNEPEHLTIDFENGFYFTDPSYRHRGNNAVRKEDVYYVSKDGEISRVSTICRKPNGIILTADCKILYVVDNGAGHVYKYDVPAPGKLANETLLINDARGADGIYLDAEGNLYIGCSGNGLRIYDKAGKFIGHLGTEYGIPYASSCVFGGPDFSILYITARDQFLGIPMKVRGILPPSAGNRVP